MPGSVRRWHSQPMDDNSTERVVCDIAVSVDGYVAGPNQTEEKVFGDGPVEELHAWFSDDENADVVEQIVAAGAFVMGRNMFGPVRGEWDRNWRGWWGEDPPYHGPVFVLTHHTRDPVPMEGGTTFTFVTDGIETPWSRPGPPPATETWPSRAAPPR